MNHSEKNSDLHGNVPDSCSAALILLDVITDFDFPGGDQLLEQALPLAPRLRKLAERARQAGIPVLYVNDNFGRWQSDFAGLVQRCLSPESSGRSFVEPLRPGDKDYFILKPKHSGFFGTTLEVLLKYLQARSLIIAGLTGNMCVQFTATDAYLRDFHLFVPADCTASLTKDANDQAIKYMGEVLKADVRPSEELDLQQIINM